jgi:hypothetical protein
LSTIGFYSGHAFNVALGILLASLGLFIPSYKEALKGFFYFVVLALSILVLDLVLRSVLDPHANYFYFFDPEGAGILEALHKLIPVPIVYELPILPLALGIFAVQAGAYRWVKRLFGSEPEPRVGPDPGVGPGLGSAAWEPVR